MTTNLAPGIKVHFKDLREWTKIVAPPFNNTGRIVKITKAGLYQIRDELGDLVSVPKRFIKEVTDEEYLIDRGSFYEIMNHKTRVLRDPIDGSISYVHCPYIPKDNE